MQNRHKLIVLITAILLLGFLAVSLLTYRSSKQLIHEAIIINELPLTSDSINSKIQEGLLESIDTSSMMASNTFLKDWVTSGEKDEASIKQYLIETKRQSHALASYFISEKTRNYYSSDAKTKKVIENAKADSWYFKVRSMNKPYELFIERNARYGSQLAIFVNYRIFDQTNQYIGVVGVGIAYNKIQKLLDSYEKRFKHKVYFVDKNGIIMLASDQDRPLGADIDNLLGIKDIHFNPNNLANINIEDNKIHRYELGERAQNVIVRYVPELNWYLIAEKSETDALTGITRSLYQNLLLCLFITALVVVLTYTALKRYHFEVESAAAIDKLTNLPNRKAFDIGISVLLNDSQRHKTTLGLMLLDLDHFKAINDTYGHLAGDYVLTETAETLRSTIRSEDFICRWGGEEFVIVVRDCDEQHLMLLAEKIRAAIEAADYTFKGTSIAVTTSLGVATRIGGEYIDHMIYRADKALYRAKHAGRNQAVLAS